MTDPAYRDMESRANTLTQRVGTLVRRLLRRSRPAAPVTNGAYAQSSEHQAHLRLVTRHTPETLEFAGSDIAADAFRWRRHPQLRRELEGGRDVDSDDMERGARSAGVRGLFLARSGRLNEAQAAFALAARDPSTDLTAIPGFWDLPRGGMTAAVHAYEEVERYRDAAALGARLRLHYRPRSLPAEPVPLQRRRSASGS